jgi:Regulator of ribonuclease activity B
MPTDFPNDANGDVLRRIQKNGGDLTNPRNIEFTVVFPAEISAGKFAEYATGIGDKVSISNSNCVPDLPWDVIVVKRMVPTHQAITRFEETLESAAEPLGGRNDGWGTLSHQA